MLLTLVRRQLRKEFPLFYWYTIAHLIDSVVSFIATKFPGDTYFYVYWGWEAIDAVLTLVVIQSVFMKIFDSYFSLRKLGLIVFRWSTVVFCGVALVAAMFAPGNGDSQLMRGALVMESSIQIVQAGLLLCLFFFSKVFGLTWKHYIYGIILGFGVCAAISLIAAAVRTKVGPNYHHYLSWALSVAYTCGLITWMYYFLSPLTIEASAKPPSSVQLHAWNEALAGLLRK